MKTITLSLIKWLSMYLARVTSAGVGCISAMITVNFFFSEMWNFFVISLLLSSCISKSSDLSLSQKNTLIFFKPTELYPKNAEQIAYYDDSVRQQEHYYFLEKKDNTLFQGICYDSSDRKQIILQAVNLQHLFGHSNYPIEAMGVISPDSLVFISGSLQEICVTDNQGHVRKQWHPTKRIYGDTDYIIYTYLQPIFTRKSLIYVQSAPEIGMIIEDSSLFHKCLLYRSGLVLSVRDTSFALSTTGSFPKRLRAYPNRA